MPAGDALHELRRIAILLRTALVFVARYVRDLSHGRAYARARLPVRFRRALEDAGLTYVKLGQFLAIRFDLIPADVCRELEALFENVRPLPFESVRQVIEQDFGTSLEVLYPAFVRKPIASASVAQVHEATTASGERVAVKVQRPDVARIVTVDIRILVRAARIADALHLFGSISLEEAMIYFADYTRRELDFVQEGETADRLRRTATEFEVVPHIYWHLCSSRVLTMEFIEGVTLGELVRSFERDGTGAGRARLPHLDFALALHRLAHASLHQLFITGFFHGDPHPGNVIILRDNRVAFVDFGIFGELTPRHRQLLRGFLEHLAIGDFNGSFEHYSRLFETTGQTDFARFKRETLILMRRWFSLSTRRNVPVQERLAGKFSDEMSLLVRQNHLRMDINTLLFWRVLIILDSTALRFSEDFDLVTELRSFFRGRQKREIISLLLPFTRKDHLLESMAASVEISRRVSNIAASVGRRTSQGVASLHTRNTPSRRKDLSVVPLACSVCLVSAAAAASAGAEVAGVAVLLAALVLLYARSEGGR